MNYEEQISPMRPCCIQHFEGISVGHVMIPLKSRDIAQLDKLFISRPSPRHYSMI